MKILRVLVIIFIVIFFSVVLYRNRFLNSSFSDLLTKKNTSTVSVNNKTIYVDLAITNEEKSRGLSGRKNLSWDKGMLFIFDYKSMPIFWMKDMHFPLDIIWINDNVIADIDENIPFPINKTDIDQLSKYSPSEPINYVLEVNAGFCNKEKVQIGDSVEIKLNIN